MGIHKEVPGFNISIQSLSCILLVHKREEKLTKDNGSASRYTSETLMDDLGDVGVPMDAGYDEVIQQIHNENYISIDDDDQYYSERLSMVLIKLFNIIYPTMKGFLLIAYFVQTADEIDSGQKTLEEAVGQMNDFLKTNGVSVDLKKMPKGYQLGIKKIALTPPDKIKNKKKKEAFSKLFKERLEKKEKTIDLMNKKMKEMPFLPVLPLNEQFVKQQINRNFSSSSDITDIILSDVAMTINVLKTANKNTYRPIATISHAIMLLGHEELKQIINEFPSLKMYDDPDLRRELEYNFICSYMSKCLTKQFGKKKEIKDVEQMCIGSMIHNLGQLLILCYYPEAYFQIKTLLRQMKNNKRKAARHVLGTTYDNIGIYFARKWRLPFITIESLKVCYFNRVGKTKDNLVINLPFCATELCAFSGGILNDMQKIRLRELINSLNMFSRDLTTMMDNAWTETRSFSKKQKITFKKRVLSEIATTG